MKKYLLEFKSGESDWNHVYNLFYIGQEPAPTYEQFKNEVINTILGMFDEETDKNLEAIKQDHIKRYLKGPPEIKSSDSDKVKVIKLQQAGIEAELPVGPLFKKYVGSCENLTLNIIGLAVENLDPLRWREAEDEEYIGLCYDEAYFFKDKSLKDNFTMREAWEEV